MTTQQEHQHAELFVACESATHWYLEYTKQVDRGDNFRDQLARVCSTVRDLHSNLRQVHEQLANANRVNENLSKKKEHWKELALQKTEECNELKRLLETERCNKADAAHDELKAVLKHPQYTRLSGWYDESIVMVKDLRAQVRNLGGVPCR